MTGKIWNGGVPTDIDVRTISERIGRPEQGQRWSYEEIAEIVGVSPRTNRFRTVTLAWRKQVYRLYNVVIGCETGHGFVALEEPERVGMGVLSFKGALRKLRKSRNLLSGCDDSKLSEQLRSQRSHVEMVSGRLLMAERMETRRLRSPHEECCK